MRHHDYAQRLRSNPSKAQLTLWHHLRRRQIQNCKFRREHPIGSYIVDFVCLDKQLVVEIDGGQHATQNEYDERRTTWLKANGFTVLRFWNNEVLGNPEGVVSVILEQLEKV